MTHRTTRVLASALLLAIAAPAFAQATRPSPTQVEPVDRTVAPVSRVGTTSATGYAASAGDEPRRAARRTEPVGR